MHLLKHWPHARYGAGCQGLPDSCPQEAGEEQLQVRPQVNPRASVDFQEALRRDEIGELYGRRPAALKESTRTTGNEWQADGTVRGKAHSQMCPGSAF